MNSNYNEENLDSGRRYARPENKSVYLPINSQ